MCKQCLKGKPDLPQTGEFRERLNKHYDYLVVGAGLYGAVFTREATDHGKKCLVIDRRLHIGGNVYCEEIAGITVHKYGAHIFHTEQKEIWEYVNRYVKFLPYIHRVLAKSKGRIYSLPFNMNTFWQIWGTATKQEAEEKLSKQRARISDPSNLEEQALCWVGKEIYELLIKGYTEKQWGRSCEKLPASIIQRIPLRMEYDDRYFTDSYQGIPEGGYNPLIEKLLEGSAVVTSVDYWDVIEAFPDIADKVVYTGAIDQFFGYCLGQLEYRSLRFEERILEQEDFQGRAVVNYCDDKEKFTRIIEHKHFADIKSPKTVLTYEYPERWTPGKEPYYPVNDEKNSRLYLRYLQLAREHPHVIFGGRLGSYRYYNMDEVVAEALKQAKREFGSGIPPK